MVEVEEKEEQSSCFTQISQEEQTATAVTKASSVGQQKLPENLREIYCGKLSSKENRSKTL